MFINEDQTPFATLKHRRRVVKIPIELPDVSCRVRFEGKLWYEKPDGKGTQILFKASREAATLADKEVGLVAGAIGATIGEFEVFTFIRQTAELPKPFQQKSGHRRVEIYVFENDATISYQDGEGAHEKSLTKHSITELFIPGTFCCELPGKMRSQYDIHDFHQKQFMTFYPGGPEDIVFTEVGTARASPEPPAPQAPQAPEDQAPLIAGSPQAPRVEEAGLCDACPCSIQ